MKTTDHTTLDDGTFAEIVAYYGSNILNIDFSLSGHVLLPILVVEVMNDHYWKLTYTKLGTWKLQDFACDANCGHLITADVASKVGRTVHMIHRIDEVVQ